MCSVFSYFFLSRLFSSRDRAAHFVLVPVLSGFPTLRRARTERGILVSHHLAVALDEVFCLRCWLSPCRRGVISNIVSVDVATAAAAAAGCSLLPQMKACVRSRWRPMVAAFRRHDASRTGTVSPEEFRQARRRALFILLSPDAFMSSGVTSAGGLIRWGFESLQAVFSFC